MSIPYIPGQLAPSLGLPSTAASLRPVAGFPSLRLLRKLRPIWSQAITRTRAQMVPTFTVCASA